MSCDESYSDTEMCENLIFVNLLKEYKILFDKDCTPSAKSRKKTALNSLTTAFNLKAKQNLSSKQVIKKFNNMKARIKEATDRKRGSKKIIFKAWEQIFFDLWSAEDGNLFFDRIPGASAPKISRRNLERDSKESSFQNTRDCDVFKDIRTEDLQRLYIIAQIKAARAQEKAALAQEKAAAAQEELALKQIGVLESKERDTVVQYQQ